MSMSMEGSVDVIITVIGVESSLTNNDPESTPYPVSKTFKLEFESEETAMRYLRTARIYETEGLLDVSALVGAYTEL